MKNLIWIFALALIFAACANEGGSNSNTDSGAAATPTTDVTTPVTPPPPAIPENTNAQNQVNIPAGPDGIVHHYICEKMDGGFGTAAGACPKCGAAMAHNSAFHAQPQGGPQNTPNVTIQNQNGATLPSTISTTPPPGLGGPQAAPPPVEPPQNANGVWHYTCPKGCTGGAGGASPCGLCGTTLVHNTAYHQ